MRRFSEVGCGECRGLDEFSPGSTLPFLIFHLFLSWTSSHFFLFFYIWLGFRLRCGDLSIPLSHLQPRANWGLRVGWCDLLMDDDFHDPIFLPFPCHSGLKLDQLWMPWKRTSIYKNIIISTNPLYINFSSSNPTNLISIHSNPKKPKKKEKIKEIIKRENVQIIIIINIQNQNKFS